MRPGASNNFTAAVRRKLRVGAGGVRTEVRSWNFPICARCLDHAHAFRRVRLAIVAGALLLVPFFLFSTAVGLVAGGAELAGSGFALWWLRKLRYPTCCRLHRPVRYRGWHDTTVEFEVSSVAYSVQLARLNQSKLTKTGRRLKRVLAADAEIEATVAQVRSDTGRIPVEAAACGKCKGPLVLLAGQRTCLGCGRVRAPDARFALKDRISFLPPQPDPCRYCGGPTVVGHNDVICVDCGREPVAACDRCGDPMTRVDGKVRCERCHGSVGSIVSGVWRRAAVVAVVLACVAVVGVFVSSRDSADDEPEPSSPSPVDREAADETTSTAWPRWPGMVCGNADASVARRGVDVTDHRCLSESTVAYLDADWGTCLERAEYTAVAGNGCPAQQRCCPPPVLRLATESIFGESATPCPADTGEYYPSCAPSGAFCQCDTAGHIIVIDIDRDGDGQIESRETFSYNEDQLLVSERELRTDEAIEVETTHRYNIYGGLERIDYDAPEGGAIERRCRFDPPCPPDRVLAGSCIADCRRRR